MIHMFETFHALEGTSLFTGPRHSAAIPPCPSASNAWKESGKK
jgi:hypothetical protein